MALFLSSTNFTAHLEWPRDRTLSAVPDDGGARALPRAATRVQHSGTLYGGGCDI